MAVKAARAEEPLPEENPPDLGSRDAAIVRARGRGDTLSEIAARFGLSAERVRQIVALAGTVDKRAARHARSERDRAAAQERAGEMLAAWRAGAGYGELAAELGVSRACLEAVLKAHMTPADRWARRRILAVARNGGLRRHTDAQLLEVVREVVKRAGEVPTGKRYDEIARAQGLPSISTIENRLGGWNAALQAAGYSPVSYGRSSYTVRWTGHACLEAARRAADELGGIPSLREYELLSQGRDDLPSAATLRKRLGLWSQLTLRLADEGRVEPEGAAHNGSSERRG